MLALDARQIVFPSREALQQAPSDIVATHGNLNPDTLIAAYRQGVFPWYMPGEPILWHCPNPRLVIDATRLHVSRSLAQTMRRKPWVCVLNGHFNEVISACAHRGEETWISAEMQQAYQRLHALGYAHSVAVLDAKENLIGGLYGVGIGKMYFGESMFSHQSDASKVAFAKLCQHLVKHGLELIDCQVFSDHLVRLGAYLIPRHEFLLQSERLCQQIAPKSLWQKQVLD